MAQNLRLGALCCRLKCIPFIMITIKLGIPVLSLLLYFPLHLSFCSSPWSQMRIIFASRLRSNDGNYLRRFQCADNAPAAATTIVARTVLQVAPICPIPPKKNIRQMT